jgi:hypothetical protein
LNLKTKEDKYGQHGFSQFALKGSSLLYNAKNKNKKPFYEPSYNFTTLKSVFGRLLTTSVVPFVLFKRTLDPLLLFWFSPGSLGASLSVVLSIFRPCNFDSSKFFQIQEVLAKFKN